MDERIKDIHNFVRLSDRIATAGQPRKIQYPAIATAGDRTSNRSARFSENLATESSLPNFYRSD